MKTLFTTRKGTENDFDFIARVQRESMEPYIIARSGAWDTDAQMRRLRETEMSAHEIFEVEHVPVGCNLVETAPGELRLARLYILPSCQGRGIGSAFLANLCFRADAEGLPVTLRVMRENPARRLYERFGFEETGETPTHFYMRRSASSRNT